MSVDDCVTLLDFLDLVAGRANDGADEPPHCWTREDLQALGLLASTFRERLLASASADVRQGYEAHLEWRATGKEVGAVLVGSIPQQVSQPSP